MSSKDTVINIVGDIYLPHLQGWSFSTKLKDVLSEGYINVINLEAPIYTDGSRKTKKSGPSLYQDINVPSWLETEGFNVIDCANNHIFDYGEEAMINTLNAFTPDVLRIGIGNFNEAYSIKVVETNGQRIGFLAVTQYEFGVLDDELYSMEKVGAAWMCHPKVDELISSAHQQCDILIVLPHAGLEHFELPLPEIRTLYRHYINMGADAVVASHPHIAQPWEEYKGKPIFYSLGNFCFDMTVTNKPLYNKGVLAQLVISREGSISLKIEKTCYNVEDKLVDLCIDDNFSTYLNKINNVFRDEKIYINEVNTMCLQLRYLYNLIMEMGGYYNVSTLRKATSVLKQYVTALVRGRKVVTNNAHFINTIRCETHRWVMSRIYELQNKR